MIQKLHRIRSRIARFNLIFSAFFHFALAARDSFHINVDVALCLLPHDNNRVGTVQRRRYSEFRHGSVSLIERSPIRRRDLHLQRPLHRLEYNFERVTMLQLQRVRVCAVHGFDI